MRTPALAVIAVPMTCIALLAGCASKPGIESLKKPLASGWHSKGLLDPSRLSDPSRDGLRDAGLHRTARTDPAAAIREIDSQLRESDSIGLRLAGAELALIAAQRLRESDPGEAGGFYLTAVELSGPMQRYPHSEARLNLRAIYNESCAELAAVFHEALGAAPDGKHLSGPLRDYHLRWKTGGADIVDPCSFENLRPASFLKVKGFGERNTQEGVGGPLVAYQQPTPERRAANPFMPRVGFAVPVTAIVRSPSPGRAQIELRDVVGNDQIVHRGRRQRLEADFTAAVATMSDAAPSEQISWRGTARPERVTEREGLYLFEPYRRDRIPLILVHGLLSGPRTWLEVVNTLYADPVLRARYQPLVFFYPTGYPILRNAAKLRGDLREFQRHFDPGRTNRNMRSMVLVGHSMGGILCNAQIRRSGDDNWNKLFDKPLDDIEMTPEQRQGFRDLIYYEANPDIGRVIFLATPHRGSPLANSWIGRRGSRIITFPLRVVDSASETLLGASTDLARPFLIKQKNGVDNLEAGSPVLDVILTQPVVHRTPYHSIIGDRDRGDTPDSSDGLVPYSSAHLDGAASEKIVPSKHSATRHPEAIEEIRRILYLHVGERFEPRQP